MYEHVVDTITHDTDDRLRVLIVADLYPSEPYDDGGSPILRIKRDGWYGGCAEQLTRITSHAVDPRIEEAAGKWASEPDVFERYLRIFHGTTEVKWYDPHDGDYTFVSFDTAAWRAEMGLPEDRAELQAYAEKHDCKPGWLVNMTEWRAYCEGDVYGYVVEEKVTWHAEGHEDREAWEPTEYGCWGFYGYGDYLQAEARSALTDAAADRMPATPA